MQTSDLGSRLAPAPPHGLQGNLGFLILGAGQAVSQAGTAVFTVALFWTAAHMGRTDAALAGVAVTLPSLLGLLGGVVADRIGRLRTLYLTDGVRTLVLMVAFVLLLQGSLPLGSLLAVALVLAAGNALFGPAQMSLIPDLVRDEDLPSANGLNLAGTQVGSLAGYLLGGAFVAIGGLRLPILADAFSYGLSVLSLFVVRAALERKGNQSVREKPVERTPGSPKTRPGAGLADLRTGLAHVWQNPALKTVLPLAMLTNLLFAPMVSGLAVVARTMHLTPVGYSVLEASWAVGAIAGGAIAGRLLKVIRAPTLLGPGMLAGALCLMAAGLWLHSPMTQVGIGLGAAMNGISNATLLTWLQRTTPASLRSRVFGVVLTSLTVAMPLGLGLYGAFAGALPGGAAPMLAGASLGVFALFAWLPTTARRIFLAGFGPAAAGELKAPGVYGAEDRSEAPSETSFAPP